MKELKDTHESNTSVSYLDLLLSIRRDGQLGTSLYDKCDDFKRKGRDLTQSKDKSPYSYRKIKNATWPNKNTTKNFDYTTIADQLRVLSWSNNSFPTGMVNERPTSPLTTKVV